jgi:hypothetical protein
MSCCAPDATPADEPAVTRELLGWEPNGPSLLDGLDEDHYYREG